jgi:membrane protein implicated in regulation of membrane protease activity
MSEHAIWWILAAVLVGAELMSGTFYLLVYGIAAVAAGAAAYLGMGLIGQLVVAAVIGSAGTLILRKWRRPGADSAALQDLDVGQQVRLETWDKGRGTVKYRGALWDAEGQSDAVDSARPLYIRAIRGTILVVGN